MLKIGDHAAVVGGSMGGLLAGLAESSGVPRNSGVAFCRRIPSTGLALTTSAPPGTPFPYGEERVGIPGRPDLSFVELAKRLAPGPP